MKIRNAIAALSLAALVPLGGCTKAEDDAAGAEEQVSDRTLAAAIAHAPGLTNVSSALSDAGLAGVFDGPGSYTVLAPDDQAFAQLEGGRELTSDDAKPLLVAVLRDHIVPGHMTPEAIREAIAKKGGPVEVTTLGDGTLTFSTQGDDIAVAGQGGLRAKLDGSALTASNGVVIPIDGLLKKPQPIAQ
jgi:uncharacterized surface protein with fasciclin (FAS1) repeats